MKPSRWRSAYDRRCQRHDLRWCVEQLRDEGFDQCFGCVKAVLMALDDTAVTGNEGIVAHDVEQSIANLCALASHSMQQTDRQIIEIMASKAR